MTAARDPVAPGWRKFCALMIGMAAIGLPINHAAAYALLVVFTVVVFSGEVSVRPRDWLGSVAIVVIAAAGQFLLAPPRLDEGHNVFLPQAPALERGLPADVYRHMENAFDAAYPQSVRCQLRSSGCWQNGGFPDRVYAFSADGIWHKSDASRAVTSLDFTDPVWLRLGFVNDNRYNWGTVAPDVHRLDRDKRFWMGWRRWHLAMPWFEMLHLPAALVGGQLCWRGDVMWEGTGTFAALPAVGCRAIEAADAGRRIFGIAMKPDTLAMEVKPPWNVRLRQWGVDALILAALAGVGFALIRVQPRRLLLSFLLIGLAVIVIAVDDASFLGGVRPFDGGDDGLFYDGVAHAIMQHALAGDWWSALQGGENVFYYGGPGLRYFHAVEHVVFGESYLGYLSLVLLLPILVYLLLRRFLPETWSIALAIVFVAIPIGDLCGTTFIDYAKWAARGFADPAAYILFVAGILPIIGGAASGPSGKFIPAFFGALLLALAIFMKPIVAPAAAVLLGGAGLAALLTQQFRRLAGLCLGLAPVLSMALHNWIYGHVLVLFSANADNPLVLIMPVSAYASAARKVLMLDLSGVNSILLQLANWLSGPAESYATVPLNAAAVAILIYVVCRGRQFDPWLRLLGGAALAQHAVALFYIAVGRYHYLAWLLTMVVVIVWFRQVGMDWLRRRWPLLTEHPRLRWLSSGLAWLQGSVG